MTLMAGVSADDGDAPAVFWPTPGKSFPEHSIPDCPRLCRPRGMNEPFDGDFKSAPFSRIKGHDKENAGMPFIVETDSGLKPRLSGRREG
ncbi:MAG: hypothetical protein LBI87_05890 [Candidatus Accumulibacter sp.]|jgi:hypothetical protein|nr:hypothetical protein [Accumulibacter sp.]